MSAYAPIPDSGRQGGCACLQYRSQRSTHLATPTCAALARSFRVLRGGESQLAPGVAG